MRANRPAHLKGNATVEVPATAVVSHQFAPEGVATDFVLSNHFPVLSYFTIIAEERNVDVAAAHGNVGWSWGFDSSSNSASSVIDDTVHLSLIHI